MAEPVFVFGSNLAGRHGKGAALYALRWRGAVYGVGEGRTGNSYALPTKGHRLQALPFNRIAQHAERFLTYARQHGDEQFQLTAVGCGLAGFHPEQIAPLFERAPANVLLPPEFAAVLDRRREKAGGA